MKDDIINFNKFGELHGYQEWYFGDKLMYRTNNKHLKLFGYNEWHGLKETEYYIR